MMPYQTRQMTLDEHGLDELTAAAFDSRTRQFNIVLLIAAFVVVGVAVVLSLL